MGRRTGDKRIDELCDERNAGNGWFVYLRPGFRLNDAHCFGEDTLREVWATMKQVQTCGCDECRELICAETTPAAHECGASA